MITEDQYLHFVDRALDGMGEVLGQLGDELANVRPDLPGANSPYALVTHCLAVVDYWAGHLVAGRPVERDREAEFTASGSAKELAARIDGVKRQLRQDLAVADPGAPLRNEPPAQYLKIETDLTQGAALLHLYEELAQHLGQLEVTRDLIAERDAGMARR